MDNSKFIRFAGLVGMDAAFYVLSAVFASTILAGESFSWSKNALSDLGVSQVPNVANLFNFSLILGGVLTLIFAVGFVKAYGKNLLFNVGGIILMLGSVSLSFVGIITETYGVLHGCVSMGYYVLFPLALVLVGTAFFLMNMKVKAYVSILAGTIALIVILSSLATRWHKWLSLGFAVPEIIEAIIIAAWVVWMGASLVRLKS